MEQGFRGNCDFKGKLGMCPSLAELDAIGFPKKNLLFGKTVFRIRQKGVPPLLLPTSVLQLPRCLVRICNLFHKEQPIVKWTVSKNAIAAGKTSCKFNTNEFASQTWATRPHLGSIFKKLLHRKIFQLPAAHLCKNYSVLYDFHTVFIDTHQQECYNIDVHRKNEFR